MLQTPYKEILARKSKAKRCAKLVPFVFPFMRKLDCSSIVKDVAQFAIAQHPHEPLAFTLPQPVAHRVLPSLKQKLIRSTIQKWQRLMHGCTVCKDDNCLLHDIVLETDEIESLSVFKTYRIHGQLDCLSRHVCYVWSCSCGMQGVGECVSFPARAKEYFRALAAPVSEKDKFTCSIEKHFCEFHTDRSELSICFVEMIKAKHLCKPYLLPALRKRMENRWTHKLDAKLNTYRFLHHSFSGNQAARSTAY